MAAKGRSAARVVLLELSAGFWCGLSISSERAGLTRLSWFCADRENAAIRKLVEGEFRDPTHTRDQRE